MERSADCALYLHPGTGWGSSACGGMTLARSKSHYTGRCGVQRPEARGFNSRHLHHFRAGSRAAKTRARFHRAFRGLEHPGHPAPVGARPRFEFPARGTPPGCNAPRGFERRLVRASSAPVPKRDRDTRLPGDLRPHRPRSHRPHIVAARRTGVTSPRATRRSSRRSQSRAALTARTLIVPRGPG